MISTIKRRIAQHLINRPGWRTGRKIVVIESDDWGSIRMPSAEAYNKLLGKGGPVDKSPYCRYDSLASENDLEFLFDLLSGFKDHQGNHPVITANTVVSNPDFDRIRESGFSEYFCEPITETFKRYPKHARCLDLWKSADESGLFHPQSHGKEHLNVKYWLRLLHEDIHHFRDAFNYRCWGLSNDIYPEMKRSIQASFDMESRNDLPALEDTIRNGLRLFEKLFGYKSMSFIATNFIWSSQLNWALYQEGVRYFQGMKYQKLPLLNGNKREMVRHHLGDRNDLGQYYLIRNCSFEPAKKGREFDCIDDCLKGVSTAFFWNKPAIISSHRLNYVGFLDEGNRDRNLRGLKTVLTKVLKRWPDVEFMASDTLGRIIENKALPVRPAVHNQLEH